MRLLTPDQFSPFAPMTADRRNTTAVIRMLDCLMFETGGSIVNSKSSDKIVFEVVVVNLYTEVMRPQSRVI